jgi:predicted Zn-dependent protease
MKRLLAILVAILTGCTSGPRLLPESYLASMANGEFEQMKQQMLVSQDPALIARAERVGRAIATQVDPLLPGAQWEFIVFEDPQVNAFALPGGKIGVFTGLLSLATTDDELAVVMGHEVAHVLLQHGNERVSAELLRGLGAVAVLYGTRNRSETDREQAMLLYGVGSQVGVMLPYSRHHEHEADSLGLEIMARAGYDPAAGAIFWQKMGAQSGGVMPEFLSTHPNYENRIQRLREAAGQIDRNRPLAEVVRDYRK